MGVYSSQEPNFAPETHPNDKRPSVTQQWDVTKPYRFIGFGAMDITKPYRFIGFGAMDVTKPYRFIGFGAMDITKPYKFTCLHAHSWNLKLTTRVSK